MKKPLPKHFNQKAPAVRQPTAAETNHLVALFNQHQNEALEQAARALLKKYPKHGFTWKVLGAVLQRMGRMDESLEAKKTSADLLPQDAEAAYNLGNAYNEMGKLAEAEVCFRKAIKINPQFKKTNYNLAIVLTKLERQYDAKVHYLKEIEVNPTFAEAHSNLGNILKNLGDLAGAEQAYRDALKANPSYLEAYTNLLYTLAHNPDVPPEHAFEEAKRFGEIAAQGVTPYVHSPVGRDPNKKLRIGFVSGDFYHHAVAFFIEPLLEKMNREQFELVAYYNNKTNDFVTQRLKPHFCLWRDIPALTDQQVAQQIFNDGIDILIDLSGHTDKNRLLAFAYKPAPIQVSWIGFPGTSGVAAMDYYFVDPDWAPIGMFDDYFVEKLVYLPTAGTFTIPDDNVPVVDSPALRKGYVTFGSFNRTSKLTQPTLDLWCKVLNEVPSSKMLIGNVSDIELQKQLEDEFSRRGVSPERLTFHAKKSIPEYLKLHGEVDFILDTFPYTGGTTTGFALVMGVPVLTLAGKTLAARQGVSMLSLAELHKDFVAESEAQFMFLAKKWCTDVSELQSLRHQLRERMRHSPKRNPENLLKGIETAWKMMWQIFCQEGTAKSFVVNN